MFVTLSAPGLTGCSFGLDFDGCSNDQQCPDSEMCVEGVCEAVATTGAPECTPPDVEACACPEGGFGNRLCLTDGTFGICDCATDPSTSTSDATTQSDSTGGDDTMVDESTSSTSSTSSDSSSGSSSSSSSGGEGCVQVTPDAVIRDQGNTPSKGNTRLYLNIGDLGVGDETDDEFRVEFWFAAGAGEHDLGTAVNTQYSSCTHCLRLYEDSGPTTPGQNYFVGRQYLQSEGTMTVADDPQDGDVSVTLEGVRLVEVTFSQITSTPVEDGDCVEIADGTYSTPVPPPGWTCAIPAYTDGLCDCGCGEPDLACADGELNSCGRCDASGSCNEGGGSCPGTIDPADTTACLPPAEWTCMTDTYGDGTCHCGCGALDVDCPDATGAACEACNAEGSCAVGQVDCSTIDDADNSACM